MSFTPEESAIVAQGKVQLLRGSQIVQEIMNKDVSILQSLTASELDKNHHLEERAQAML